MCYGSALVYFGLGHVWKFLMVFLLLCVFIFHPQLLLIHYWLCGIFLTTPGVLQAPFKVLGGVRATCFRWAGSSLWTDVNWKLFTNCNITCTGDQPQKTHNRRPPSFFGMVPPSYFQAYMPPVEALFVMPSMVVWYGTRYQAKHGM